MNPLLAGFSDELNGLEKTARPLKKLIDRIKHPNKGKAPVGREPLVPRTWEPPVSQARYEARLPEMRPIKKFDYDAWRRNHWQEKSRGMWRGHTGEPALVKRTDRTPAELKKMRAERAERAERRMRKTSAELVKAAKPLKRVLEAVRRKPPTPIDPRFVRSSPGAPSLIEQVTHENLKNTAKYLDRLPRGATKRPAAAAGKRRRTPREATPPPAERPRAQRRLPADESRARRRSPRETIAPQEKPYRSTGLARRW